MGAAVTSLKSPGASLCAQPGPPKRVCRAKSYCGTLMSIIRFSSFTCSTISSVSSESGWS